jgi:hypothetical protein
MAPMDQQTTPVTMPRLLPLTTATVVIAMLSIAVIIARLKSPADAASDRHKPARSIAAAFAPDHGAATCQIPTALTQHQLRDLADGADTRPTALAPPVPAPASLHTMLARLTASDCDAQPGRYAYVLALGWTFDTTISSGKSRNRLSVTQYQVWRAEDDSGRAVRTSIREPAADDTYSAGGLSFAPRRLPVTTDSPQAAISAAGDVHQWTSPSRGIRADAVRLLATSTGLQYHGEVTDRAGRTGSGYSATSANGALRDLIILNPTTGGVLAYEHAALRDPGRLGIRQPTVVSYLLLAVNTHTTATK